MFRLDYALQSPRLFIYIYMHLQYTVPHWMHNRFSPHLYIHCLVSSLIIFLSLFLEACFPVSSFCVCVYAKSLQSCPTLCNSMNCSPSGSFVHGILQARILSGLPFPPAEAFPDPGIEPASLAFPELAGGFFTSTPYSRDESEYYNSRMCFTPGVGLPMGSPGDSEVKNLPSNEGDTGSIPGSGRMATHSSTVALKIPWLKESGRLYMVHGFTKESDTT